MKRCVLLLFCLLPMLAQAQHRPWALYQWLSEELFHFWHDEVHAEDSSDADDCALRVHLQLELVNDYNNPFGLASLEIDDEREDEEI